MTLLAKFYYRCIDDIDLYPGIMSEKRRCGEVLGPTQKCLIGLQFRALRDGDRFWYEKKDRVTGFTKGRTSLHHVLFTYSGSSHDLVLSHPIFQTTWTQIRLMD